MNTLTRIQAAAIAALCVVGTAPAASAAKPSKSSATEGWWKAFQDPVLTRLVDEGLEQNFDLKASAARATQADVSKWQALTPTLPNLSVDVNGNAAPLNALGFSFGGLPGGDPNAEEPTIFDAYYNGTAMLNARMSIDLGSSVMNFRAGAIDAEASHLDVTAQSATVATRIASAYFDVIAAQSQIEIIQKQIDGNQALVDVVQLRYERGESSALDVLQQRQQLQSAETQLPTARSQARILRYQLGLLVGRDGPVDIDEAPAAFPVLGGTPTRDAAVDLVESRPDLTASKRRLQAAESRVLASWLKFLPTVSLQGNTGWQANWFDVEDDPNTLFTWGAGAGISIPLFSGLSRVNGLRSSEAAVAVARANYEGQRRQRLLGVEQARIQEEEFRIQLDAAERQTASARLTADKSREQYVAGFAPMTSVLIATTSAQVSELNALNIRRRLLDARVNLLDALGGEWAFDLPAPAPLGAALPIASPARPRVGVSAQTPMNGKSQVSADAPLRMSSPRARAPIASAPASLSPSLPISARAGGSS